MSTHEFLLELALTVIAVAAVLTGTGAWRHLLPRHHRP